MNGHLLQTLREQLKVPGSGRVNFSGGRLLRFRSRLNETSGGLGKIGAVSGSDCRILKFLRPNYSWSQIFYSQIFLFSDFHSQIFSFSDFSFSDFFILRFSFSDFIVFEMGSVDQGKLACAIRA